MPTTAPRQPLRLEPIAGPETESVALDPEAAAVVFGRSLQCDHPLGHESVSRRHATFSVGGGRWLVTDLGSRHGTFLNAQQLAASRPSLLGDGDLVRIGPYTFRVGLGDYPSTIASSTMDLTADAHTVEAVAPRSL